MIGIFAAGVVNGIQALAAVCPQCGAFNQPDERFCGECGAPLGASVVASDEAPVGTPILPFAPLTPERAQPMSRRNEIQFTPEEQASFLSQPHKASLATIDKEGFPHLVAMGYRYKDG
jgi:hypothetical protein